MRTGNQAVHHAWSQLKMFGYVANKDTEEIRVLFGHSFVVSARLPFSEDTSFTAEDLASLRDMMIERRKNKRGASQCTIIDGLVMTVHQYDQLSLIQAAKKCVLAGLINVDITDELALKGYTPGYAYVQVGRLWMPRHATVRATIDSKDNELPPMFWNGEAHLIHTIHSTALGVAGGLPIKLS